MADYLAGTEFYGQLINIGAKPLVIHALQQWKYPHDAQFNACAVGKQLIYAPAVTAVQIVSLFTNGWGTVPIVSRQGYAKCSVCVVDENSIITADRGIARAAEKSGLDVLLITPGHIDLSGFDYGFIGGAAFRLSDRLIAFTGLLDRHPDKGAIMEFIAARGFGAVFLTERKIFDIGSALPILEKQS